MIQMLLKMLHKDCQHTIKKQNKTINSLNTNPTSTLCSYWRVIKCLDLEALTVLPSVVTAMGNQSSELRKHRQWNTFGTIQTLLIQF